MALPSYLEPSIELFYIDFLFTNLLNSTTNNGRILRPMTTTQSEGRSRTVSKMPRKKGVKMTTKVALAEIKKAISKLRLVPNPSVKMDWSMLLTLKE